MNVPIRVLLADANCLFRQGLRRLLEDEKDIVVVGEASNGLEAQDLVRETRPNVVLMDYAMPIMDGVMATRRIVEANKGVDVIILTTHKHDHSVFEAIKSGAQGYLLKDTAIGELLKAIRTVHEGKSLIDPALASRVLLEFRRLTSGAGVDNGSFLSDRETQVLRLLAVGMTNKEIGDTLYLSEKTIKNYVTSIFQKLQINSRVRAAAYAMQQGLVPI